MHIKTACRETSLNEEQSGGTDGNPCILFVHVHVHVHGVQSSLPERCHPTVGTSDSGLAQQLGSRYLRVKYITVQLHRLCHV